MEYIKASVRFKKKKNVIVNVKYEIMKNIQAVNSLKIIVT